MKSEIMYHDVGRDPLFKTWHASADHMFIFIHSGEGGIVCSEKTYPIRKGVLCFIGSWKYHYTMPDEPENYIRSKLFVSDEIMKQLLHILPEQFQTFIRNSFIYAQIEEEKWQYVDDIFREMQQCENNESDSAANLLSCSLRLMILLNRYSVESTASAGGFIYRAVEYINSNIMEEIKIDDICAAVNVSKYYFCREFKKSTGLTVMNYILKTRIVLAKSMLRDNSLSITQVGEQCGFSSVSYFCRTFKQDTKMTPLAYRKRHQET